MNKPPCLNCQTREIGCHSTCKRYIIYVDRNKQRLDCKAKEDELRDNLYHVQRNRSKYKK